MAKKIEQSGDAQHPVVQSEVGPFLFMASSRYKRGTDRVYNSYNSCKRLRRRACRGGWGIVRRTGLRRTPDLFTNISASTFSRTLALSHSTQKREFHTRPRIKEYDVPPSFGVYVGVSRCDFSRRHHDVQFTINSIGMKVFDADDD